MKKHDKLGHQAIFMFISQYSQNLLSLTFDY